jgi:hypothetical protein
MINVSATICQISTRVGAGAIGRGRQPKAGRCDATRMMIEADRDPGETLEIRRPGREDGECAIA